MNGLRGLSGRLRSRFVCSEGCSFSAPLTDVVYVCEKCHGLLEVEHDVGALGTVSGEAWRTELDARGMEARLPWASGIWSKREWVYPELEDADLVSLGEGRTPLHPLPRMASRLGLGALDLKQCGISPTGSFKDLGMTVLVSAVKRMRRLGKKIRAVVCASTGDTSAALAAYCASAGIPSVVFLPKDKISLSQLVQPISHGSLVFSLSTDFDGCMKIVQEVTQDRSLYLANSMNSLRIEGQKTVGIEIIQQLRWKAPDWIVIPGGNLGNASALGKGLLLMKALGVLDRVPRVAVVQAQRANPLYRAFLKGFDQVDSVESVVAEPTLASAIRIGAPVSARRAIKVLRALNGVVEQASEGELSDAAAEADLEGAFACPHTGVALAGVQTLVQKGTIARDSHVVVVATAHGLKFPDFKIGYHRGTLQGVTSSRANLPLEVEATSSAVREALDRRLSNDKL